MRSLKLSALALCCFVLDNALAKTSYLFTGATIISFDPATSRTVVYEKSSLLTSGSTIVEIYNGTTPKSYEAGTKVIDARGKIITPGFIDTHHHLWSTVFKTVASNTTLADYVQRYGEYGATIQYMTAQDKYVSQLAGALELLYAGTTTVVDHAHGSSSSETAKSIFDATLESGLRTYFAPTVHTLPNNFTYEEQIATIASIAGDKRLKDSVVSVGLSYDEFALSPPEFIDQLWSLVQSQNLSFVTTHSGLDPYGVVNSPTDLSGYGWLTANTTIPIIFSHAGFIKPDDMSLLRETNQYISITPESEDHYGHGNPDSHLIQDQASMGLDTHITFSTDMVGQARFWMQRTRGRMYDEVLVEGGKIPVNNPMSVEQAFYLITRAGALALRRDDLGMLVPGAKADIVVFDGESPNMLGWSDAVAAVVLHSNVGDIEHVLVNGEFVKRDGKLTYKKYAKVKQQFLESSRRIQDIWAGIEFPPLTGKFQNLTEYGTVPQVDTLRGEGNGY